jgi:hypothetical protein
LKKISFEGPIRFYLCKKYNETNFHLIFFCNYTLEVWKEENRIIEFTNAWKGNNIDEALQSWLSNPSTSNYKSLPLTICWGFG